MRKFKDKRTEKLFAAEKVKGVPPDIMQRVHNKLRIVARINDLADLQGFPGMRLESLKGDRKGQYSIRVNDQWRICFTWSGREAFNIELVDYH
jgi:proteic killer suppression protein